MALGSALLEEAFSLVLRVPKFLFDGPLSVELSGLVMTAKLKYSRI